MALQAGELFATLTLDTSEFDRNFNEATNSVGTSGGMFEGLSTLGVACFAKIGDAVLEVAGKVADFVSDSIGLFGDYEENMNRISVAFGGLTDSQKEQLDGFIEDISVATGTSLDEIQQAILEMGRAGLSIEDIYALLPAVIDGATVSQRSLKDTTEDAIRTYNALGEKSDLTYQNIIDLNTAFSDSYQTNQDQIANANQYTLGSVQQLEGGYEELLQIYGMVIGSGGDLGNSGNNIRNVVNNLINPLSDASKWLQSVDIETRNVDGSMRSIPSILADMTKELDKLPTEERDSILASLFNQEDLPMVQMVMTKIKDMNYVVDDLKIEVEDVAGTCETNAQKIRDSINGSADTAKAAMNVLKKDVGETFGGLAKTMKNVMTDIIVNVTATFNQVVAKLKEFYNEHKATFDAIVRVIQPVMNTIKDIIGNVWDAIKGIFSAALDWIGALIDVFAGILTGDWEMLWNGLKDMVGSAWDGIATAIQFVVDTIIDVIAGFVGSVVNKFSEMGSGAYSKVIEIKNNITNKFHELVNSAVGAIKGLPDKIGGIFSDLASSAWDWGANILQGLIGGIESMIGSVWDKISSVASGIKDKITGALGIHSPSRVFMEYGRFIDEGLALGIERSMSKVSNATDNLIAVATPDMNSANFSGANQINVLDRLESILMGSGSARGSRDGVTYKSLFNIEHFENNRELDSEALMAEMATYIKASNRSTGF